MTASCTPAFVGFDSRDFASDLIVVFHVTRSPQKLFAQSFVGTAAGWLFPPHPAASRARHANGTSGESKAAHGRILYRGPGEGARVGPGC